MFLRNCKVKRFAEGRKSWGESPFGAMYRRVNYRKVETYENKKPEEVFTIIGVTKLQEGYSEYISSEEGYAWVQKSSKKVYIVAQSLGRRYKVLPEDIELLDKEA